MFRLFVIFVVSFSICINICAFGEEKIDSLPSSILQDAIKRKIVFDQKPINAEMKEFVLFSFNELYLHYVKLGALGSQKIYKNEEEAEKERERIYNDFQKRFPFLKLPKYSRYNYFYFLTNILPEVLAPYGVYCGLTYYGPWDKQGNFTTSDMTVSFYKIEKIERNRQFNFWGDNIFSDVIYISSKLKVAGQEIKPHPIASQHMGGMTHFMNIIIYLDGAEIEIPPGGKKASDSDYKKMVECGEKILWQQLDIADNLNRVEALAAYRMILKTNNCEFLISDVTEMLVCHELGHLIDFINKNPVAYQDEPVFDNINDYQNFFNKLISRAEVNSTLTSLRGPKKIQALYALLERSETLINGYSKEHKTAEDWILKRIIDYIETNPNKYGFFIDNSVHWDTRVQIYFQFSSLLDFPDEFDNIDRKSVV